MNNLKTLFFTLVLVSCSKDNNPQPSLTETNQPESVYGIDGLNLTYLNDIALLGDGISGINGISWNDIEPNVPQNGVHDYKLNAEMIELNERLESTGRKLQLNFRLKSDWALDRDPKQQVTSPEDGSKEDGILRVNPSYEQDLADAITYILTNLQVEALQVGSEAENEWVDPSGYIKALSIIYETAKKIKPEITIMAFGFNPANYFTKPQNFNQGLIDDKLSFVESVIKNGQLWFDVFTFHASREFEAIPPTVTWIEDQMQANGYTKPIWVDDMYSAPWLDPNFGTESEKQLFHELLNGNADAIKAFDSLQAGYIIKKLALGFESGIQKIFVSTDVDFDFYYIPNWRYAGMIKSSGQKKPAYHNLKLLIEKTNGFDQVNKLDDNLYEFSFKEKNPVYVYWEESTPSNGLTSLNNSAFIIHEFAFTSEATPKPIELTNLSTYSFMSNPVLIELTE